MKTEQYKIDYYSEMLSCGFDEAGCYGNWSNLTKEQQLQIIETVIGGIENQSMAFGYIDTPGDSYEVTRLKKQLEEAENDATQWHDAFVKNVARRHPNWEKHHIIVSKDGDAGNVLNF